MRVEIYQHNEKKIFEAANKLDISPTQLINKILETMNIIANDVAVEDKNIIFTRVKIEKKKNKKNFVNNWQ